MNCLWLLEDTPVDSQPVQSDIQHRETSLVSSDNGISIRPRSQSLEGILK